MESAEGQQCCIHILKLSSGHGTHSFPRAVVVAVHGSRSYIAYLIGIRCVLCYLDAKWSGSTGVRACQFPKVKEQHQYTKGSRSESPIFSQRRINIPVPFVQLPLWCVFLALCIKLQWTIFELVFE
jgi:hypothetical protein